MPKTTYDIQQVLFDESGVQISYLGPEDMKEPGIVHAHTLAIPTGGDYDQEIQEVLDALNYLLNDVIEDWDSLRPLNSDVRPEETDGSERPIASDRPVMGQ